MQSKPIDNLLTTNKFYLFDVNVFPLLISELRLKYSKYFPYNFGDKSVSTLHEFEK